LNTLLYLAFRTTLFLALLAGCVPTVYKQGTVDNPLNHLKLGQTYNDMVKVLGEPSQSRSEDRMTEETIILFIPLWNIVESIGDFNPSSIQIYTYNQWGMVTIDNNNHIIRIEAK
jgi:hypothetical protein